MPGIFMASLGCAKNLVETELMLGETLGGDIFLAVDPADADIIIINTCGFIEEARSEGRQVIGEYLELKKRSSRPLKVVAAGCWAERSPEALLREFPGLDAVWGLSTPHALGENIRQLHRRPAGAVSGIGKPARPAEGARLVTTLPSFAYLKLSDGCDNRCHYCAIPLIRGGLRSRSPEAVLDEAKSLADQGVGELVVIGQDTTAFGRDRGDASGLADLLEKLLAAVSVPRIRLLYAHPAHLDDRVIELLLTEPRLCRYVDLPLQHASDAMLAAMGRGYGRARVDELLARFAGDFTLRTTFLTGFPGESERDFLEMLDLVGQGRFRHVGAFAYSPEADTPSHGFSNPIPREEAEKRRDAVMAAQSAVAFAWLDSRVGGTESVLIDSRLDGGWAVGRSIHEAPDADGAIFIEGRGNEPGKFVEACIKAREGYDLMAEKTDRGGRRRRHGKHGK